MSKLWSPFQGVELNMTNGLSTMNSQGFSFSKGFSSNITPDFIAEALLDRLNLSSSRHFMYSGGIQMNIQLSNRVDISQSSEYTVGFKLWSDSRITYIEGEGGSGQSINVSVFSKGSFYAFTLGLKYNLTGN